MPTNIPKLLVVSLLYPAVLGAIVYELLLALTNGEQPFFTRLCYWFNADNWKTNLIKLVLILELLIFYGCDYINSEAAKKYQLASLLTDFITLLGMMIYFRIALAPAGEFYWDNVVWISGLQIIFMLIYLVRYLFREKEGNYRFEKLAIYEAILLIIHITIIFLSRFKVLTGWGTGIVVSLGNLFSVFLYCKVVGQINKDKIIPKQVTGLQDG